MEEQKTEDYKERLQKVRQRRNGKDPMHWFMIGGCAVIVVLALVIIVKLAQGGTFGGSGNARVASASEAEVQETVIGETLPEDEEQAKEDEEKKNVVESYQNLGIVDVSGYLNMRESASTTSDVIGKLMGGSACEILDDSQEGWYQISSGGLEGYISSEFVQTGEAAKTEAFELVKKMAVITTDKLNIRSEPSEDAQVLEQALKNERYSIVSEQDGWIQISGGYISADYADVRYALNEARKLDLRTMVLNMYDNLGISNVNNYLNIRVEPKEDAKIIGKMTSKSGGEILETTEDGGWYKIKSGTVTGYIAADPELIATGQEAKDLAMQNATQMAIITTDVLNVRVEPNTDSKIWTQIVKDERYPVVDQQDGWVQIDLGSVDTEDGSQDGDEKAYISTRDNNVEVRYALNEAIKFTPAKDSSSGASSDGSGSSTKQSRRSQLVNYALQFVGNRYVWGGTSLTNGVDCSGFTMRVMEKFGVSLPHYSGSQAQMGKKVTSATMKPGDLIFYAGSNGKVNHVAIYIGNGRIVHAASRRSGIKTSTWNYRTPVTIRSMLD